ncbi:MAG: sulfotransferase domain-containing protein [Acidobacteria bacterium]|nr:sulfotransferase domain-containing protein [Acidobacteriota bacterium]
MSRRRGSRWPNLIIAGAQKAGTTWLHNCLDRHDRVQMSSPKELFHFGMDDWNDPSRRAEYRAHFSPEPGIVVWGESTPSYLWRRDGSTQFTPQPNSGGDSADAIRSTLGDEVSVIVLLRNPVERAIAGARHQMVMGRLDPEDSIFDADPELGIIDLGFYARHVGHWIEVFDPGQICVLLYDDLEESPIELLGRAFAFLGLSVDSLDDHQVELSRQRSNTHDQLRRRLGVDSTVDLVVRPEDVLALEELYQEDHAFVSSITGNELSAWSNTDVMIEKLCTTS